MHFWLSCAGIYWDDERPSPRIATGWESDWRWMMASRAQTCDYSMHNALINVCVAAAPVLGRHIWNELFVGCQASVLWLPASYSFHLFISPACIACMQYVSGVKRTHTYTRKVNVSGNIVLFQPHPMSIVGHFDWHHRLEGHRRPARFGYLSPGEQLVPLVGPET